MVSELVVCCPWEQLRLVSLARRSTTRNAAGGHFPACASSSSSSREAVMVAPDLRLALAESTELLLHHVCQASIHVTTIDPLASGYHMGTRSRL
eukprot:COSAG06_NODE_2311_length_7102_cov_19.326432_4_plen_94_part_00